MLSKKLNNASLLTGAVGMGGALLGAATGGLGWMALAGVMGVASSTLSVGTGAMEVRGGHVRKGLQDIGLGVLGVVGVSSKMSAVSKMADAVGGLFAGIGVGQAGVLAARHRLPTTTWQQKLGLVETVLGGVLLAYPSSGKKEAPLAPPPLARARPPYPYCSTCHIGVAPAAAAAARTVNPAEELAMRHFFIHQMATLRTRGYSMLDAPVLPSRERSPYFLQDDFTTGTRTYGNFRIGRRNRYVETRSPEFLRSITLMDRVAPDKSRYISYQMRSLHSPGFSYVGGLMLKETDTVLVNTIQDPIIGIPALVFHEFAHVVQNKVGINEATYGDHGPEFYGIQNDIIRRLVEMKELTHEEVVQMAATAAMFNSDVYQQINPYW